MSRGRRVEGAELKHLTARGSELHQSQSNLCVAAGIAAPACASDSSLISAFSSGASQANPSGETVREAPCY